MRNKAKKAKPDSPAPQEPAGVPKKSGFRQLLHPRQLWHEHLEAKKAEKELRKVEKAEKELKQQPSPELTVDAARFTLGGRVIYLERVQLFTEEEEENAARFLETPEMLRRAGLLYGLKGSLRSLEFEKQVSEIPGKWQEGRLYFIGDVLGKPLSGDEEIPQFEYNGQRWVRSLVSLKNNIWTARDYFVRQRV